MSTKQKKSHRSNRLRLEKLEERNLFAALLFENFDPINNANWQSITSGTVTGASDPANYHDGNALHFRNGTTRQATTIPLNLSSVDSLLFNIRLGNSGSPWEDIDAFGENVVVEYSTNGTTFTNLHTFNLVDPTFEVADTWGQKIIALPPAAQTATTQIRWRQLDNSGGCCDHWGIDNILFGAPGDFITADVIDVAPDPRNTAVTSIFVAFSAPIDPTTFDFNDLSLRNNNGSNLISPAVTVTDLGGNTFSIGGLDTLTAITGNYNLTVIPTNISGATGGVILNQATDSWTVDTTAPTFNDIVDVTPDPRSGAGKAVNTIDLVFSEDIALASLTDSDFTLTRDGTPVTLSGLTFSKPATNRVRVSGLGTHTALGGKYVFSLDGANATDLAGNVGSSIKQDSWLANDAPIVGLGGSINYAEDSAPKPLAVIASVTDADTPAMIRGKLTVSITTNGQAQDKLSIIARGNATGQINTVTDKVKYEGRIIGTFVGGSGTTPLVVTLNTNATPAAVSALVSSIGFSSTGNYTAPESRRVQYIVEDGEGGISRPVYKTVNILPVNDAPTLTLPATSSYSLNDPAITIAPTATVTDIDSPSFNTGGLRVSVTGGDNREILAVGSGFTLAGDVISFGGQIIGYKNAGGGTNGRDLFIRFNLNATQSIVQSLVQSITFQTVGSTSSASRTLTFKLRDHAGADAETVLTMQIV